MPSATEQLGQQIEAMQLTKKKQDREAKEVEQKRLEMNRELARLEKKQEEARLEERRQAEEEWRWEKMEEG